MRLLSVIGIAFLLSATQALAASPETPILDQYLKIQSALAADTMEGVGAAAADIVKQVSASEVKDKKLADQIAVAAKELSEAKTIKKARASFKKLSTPTVKWVKETKPTEVEVVHCPMAGASWVQKKGDVRNPYYGKEMLECGEKVS